MIRIDRGPEPRGLKIAAPRRLKAAVEAFNQHGAPSVALTQELTGYGSKKTKEALFLAQHEKCAWCERLTDFSSAPVDHYRPKDGAWRNLPEEKRCVDAGHYWWLTWTWSNLLFSCARCNDAGHKANYFPLRSTMVPAAAPLAPLPLPPPSPIVEEGRATIEILKLDELAGRAQGHVRYQLLPSIEEVEQHLKDGRTQQAHRRWKRFLEDNLSPSAEWTAFTWHALDHLVPVDYRRQYTLAEPTRPGAPR
ncbi:HNH endonuclease family protein [Archangium violaceum]|uniref:hypothetical protein n=1 Tax=Archangium violaceum TaxID=83451 RepID=UPI0036D94982